ncbi:MAG: NAD(P)/FAD-dependent oxidoreductase [Chitinophagaceae bacterium]
MAVTYDAIVVGAGPNGLAAAITLQQAGLSVLLLEGKNEVGGGLSTLELTLPGFLHDTCSAVHPLAVLSPFFQSLPLQQYGLSYLYPDVQAAHPLDDGSTAVLLKGLPETAALLGEDEIVYKKELQSVTDDWPLIDRELLGPLHFPGKPLAMARFGMKALPSAQYFAKRFATGKARALWAGMAAHAVQPLDQPATSAIGLVLLAAAHLAGWPVPQGGSASIAKALAGYFVAIGGKIETGFYVRELKQLPAARAILFDVSPRQLLGIAGHKFSAVYQWQLQRYKYGMGVFKIDWALDDAIPFVNEECRRAGTVHLGNTFEEIAANEQATSRGQHPDRPFVLLAQQSIIDTTRAPLGKHTAWAYCHVPNGSTVDMTERIEQQVERFAPGFKDQIIARHTMNTEQLETHNPNYIGGDVNGGSLHISQLFTRPALRYSPYRTSAKGLYICSASTPPGGGVHGMGGYNAAKQALKDIFKITIN